MGLFNRRGDSGPKTTGVPAVGAYSGSNAAARDVVGSVSVHIDSAVVLPPEVYAHLTELQKQAHRVSNGADTPALYWQELNDQLKAEVDRLSEQLRQARDGLAACVPVAQSLTAAREEAAGLAARLAAVEAELSEARSRTGPSRSTPRPAGTTTTRRRH